jgi:hypothetical protein
MLLYSPVYLRILVQWLRLSRCSTNTWMSKQTNEWISAMARNPFYQHLLGNRNFTVDIVALFYLKPRCCVYKKNCWTRSQTGSATGSNHFILYRQRWNSGSLPFSEATNLAFLPQLPILLSSVTPLDMGMWSLLFIFIHSTSIFFLKLWTCHLATQKPEFCWNMPLAQKSGANKRQAEDG